MHFPLLFLLIIFILRDVAVFSGDIDDNFDIDELLGLSDSDHAAMSDIDQRSDFADYHDGLWNWQELLQNDETLQQNTMFEQQQHKHQFLDSETQQFDENGIDLQNMLQQQQQHQFFDSETQQFDENATDLQNMLLDEQQQLGAMFEQQQQQLGAMFEQQQQQLGAIFEQQQQQLGAIFEQQQQQLGAIFEQQQQQHQFFNSETEQFDEHGIDLQNMLPDKQQQQLIAMVEQQQKQLRAIVGQQQKQLRAMVDRIALQNKLPSELEQQSGENKEPERERRYFTIQQKKQLVEECKKLLDDNPQLGLTEAARKLNIAPSSLKAWTEGRDMKLPKLADNRRKYTTEQRLDYVRRANEMRAQNPEITLKELGEELEVPATNLSDWMKGKCMKGYKNNKCRRISVAEKMKLIDQYKEEKAKNPTMSQSGIARKMGLARGSINNWLIGAPKNE